MANTITPYDPYWYAQTALLRLYQKLGLALVVHRGYDKAPTQKGQTIKIRKPGSFAAEAMPISGATDLEPSEVEITVDQWFGVQFKLSDQELNYTQEQIIAEHIDPAAYAIAAKIDQTLADLAHLIPWFVSVDGGGVDDFTLTRKVLQERGAPYENRACAVSANLEDKYLQLATFHQANTGVDAEMAQREGWLGKKFGFDIFYNSSLYTWTGGALVPGTQLQLNADIAIGDTSVVMKDSGASLTGDVNRGDTFVIAGDDQRYAINADATAASNLITVSFEPAAEVAYSASDNVTIAQEAGGKVLNLGLQRGALALAMAPLSDIGARVGGATMGRAMDPETGLALRSSMWYEGQAADVYVRLDALWGVKVLDHNKAVRMEE